MKTDLIPFNTPHLTGNETNYILRAVETKKISGNGLYTKKCQQFFKDQLNLSSSLLTTSCTDALEMSAILARIEPGDEVILPSFTFVSTANAFALRGAKLIFCDSCPTNPNIDPKDIARKITARTKAIVVVHYAGIACEMDEIMTLAKAHNLLLIEDAAQAIDSYYKDKPLGGLGQLGAFSFHETKNIQSGEGGLLTINDVSFFERAEIIWEKGTNRSAFFRGEVAKYNWVDIGSSYLPSEITAAFLYAQLEELKTIQGRRVEIFNQYESELQELRNIEIELPHIPDFATKNGHMFYLVCRNIEERSALITYLKEKNIHAVFHYQPLHLSPFYLKENEAETLPNCEKYADQLVRLPLYYNLTEEQVSYICDSVKAFYKID